MLPLLLITSIEYPDVEVSKKFYTELFGQQVTSDLGCNVTFSGGFAVQQNFARLIDLPEDTLIKNPIT